MLRRRSAGAGVRPVRQPAPPLGRTGAGLSMARERARHLRRRQRFRLACRQRQEGRPTPQVHHGRQVRPADRQVGAGQRQQFDRAAGISGRRRGGRRREGSVRGRRLRQPPCGRVRFRDRRLQAPLGRLRQAAERREDAAIRSGQACRRSSSATRCTASASTRTGSSTPATAPTIACRFSARTGPSFPNTSTRRRRAAPARSTISCSRPTRSRRSST